MRSDDWGMHTLLIVKNKNRMYEQVAETVTHARTQIDTHTHIRTNTHTHTNRNQLCVSPRCWMRHFKVKTRPKQLNQTKFNE